MLIKYIKTYNIFKNMSMVSKKRALIVLRTLTKCAYMLFSNSFNTCFNSIIFSFIAFLSALLLAMFL